MILKYDKLVAMIVQSAELPDVLDEKLEDITRTQAGDALAYLRDRMSALSKLDEKLKEAVLRLSNGRSFETDLSRVDISQFDQERLDIVSLRREKPKLCQKYMKSVKCTMVVAMSLERAEALSKERSKNAKKLNKSKRKE